MINLLFKLYICVFNLFIVKSIKKQSNIYNGLSLCDNENVFNGSWIFQGFESSDYKSCPSTEKNSIIIDEASYLCNKYRAAEFNRDSGCVVLSYNSISDIFSKSPLGQKDIYFVGDSLGTQQYLAAMCDFEKINSSLKIKFIGEATFLPDVPCDSRCGDDGGVFLRHWLKVHPRLCMACPSGKPTKYNTENVTDSWFNRINLSETGMVIFNSGVWYNWLHAYGKMPVASFNSSDVYIKMLQLITPSIKNLVEANIKVFWIGIPSIPANDGNRKKIRNSEEFSFYASKNLIAKRFIEDIKAIFLDIADVTNKRRESDDLITRDGYHWCNPGPTAITSFINQVLFHLAALDLLKSHS